MGEKIIRGSVIGSRRIICLKFADKLTGITETEEGLREMMKEMEKYSKENELEINDNKSKIIQFR